MLASPEPARAGWTARAQLIPGWECALSKDAAPRRSSWSAHPGTDQ